MAAIERGRSEGGRVIAGGSRVGEEGYLIEPTLFEDVPDDGFLSCAEVFGPVASLYRFSTLDEGLRRANAVDFGLSAAIFTSSLATSMRFQREAQAGLLHVNSQTAGAEVHVPFGGIKSSGFGPHEQGRAALEFYTDTVTSTSTPEGLRGSGQAANSPRTTARATPSARRPSGRASRSSGPRSPSRRVSSLSRPRPPGACEGTRVLDCHRVWPPRPTPC
jgi:delta 1-pyrroline-5-carboxylate dehydrogenase